MSDAPSPSADVCAPIPGALDAAGTLKLTWLSQAAAHLYEGLHNLALPHDVPPQGSLWVSHAPALSFGRLIHHGLIPEDSAQVTLEALEPALDQLASLSAITGGWKSLLPEDHDLEGLLDEEAKEDLEKRYMQETQARLAEDPDAGPEHPARWAAREVLAQRSSLWLGRLALMVADLEPRREARLELVRCSQALSLNWPEEPLGETTDEGAVQANWRQSMAEVFTEHELHWTHLHPEDLVEVSYGNAPVPPHVGHGWLLQDNRAVTDPKKSAEIRALQQAWRRALRRSGQERPYEAADLEALHAWVQRSPHAGTWQKVMWQLIIDDHQRWAHLITPEAAGRYWPGANADGRHTQHDSYALALAYLTQQLRLEAAAQGREGSVLTPPITAPLGAEMVAARLTPGGVEALYASVARGTRASELMQALLPEPYLALKDTPCHLALRQVWAMSRQRDKKSPNWAHLMLRLRELGSVGERVLMIHVGRSPSNGYLTHAPTRGGAAGQASWLMPAPASERRRLGLDASTDPSRHAAKRPSTAGGTLVGLEPHPWSEAEYQEVIEATAWSVREEARMLAEVPAQKRFAQLTDSEGWRVMIHHATDVTLRELRAQASGPGAAHADATTRKTMAMLERVTNDLGRLRQATRDVATLYEAELRIKHTSRHLSTHPGLQPGASERQRQDLKQQQANFDQAVLEAQERRAALARWTPFLDPLADAWEARSPAQG